MIFLLLQIITGIFLSFHYEATIDSAFSSVIRLTNEVYYGWWLRFAHANGASFFFLAVYFHMARGIYYSSFLYPRQKVWLSGSIIWVLMIATAFLGYILPWGQMSFWGAMVITSLFSALPLIGGDFLFLLWGGFSISDATIKRFFGLHFCLPFVILILSILHIALVHESGSSNPTTVTIKHDGAPFLPYYIIKDYYSLILCCILFIYCVCFRPDIFGHADNFIEANPMLTPLHIVPEWYFLPLYAILRSVPDKLFGIFLIFLFFACIFLLPYICKNFIIRTGSFRPFYATIVWLFLAVCYSLGWIGGLPVISPFYEIGQLLTFLYYFLLIIMFPLCGFIEKTIYVWYITEHTSKNKKTLEGRSSNLNLLFSFESIVLYVKNFYDLKISTFFSVFYNFLEWSIKKATNIIITSIYNLGCTLLNFYTNETNLSNNLTFVSLNGSIYEGMDDTMCFFKNAYLCFTLWIMLTKISYFS